MREVAFVLVLGAFMWRSLVPVLAAVPEGGAGAGLVPVCTPMGIVFVPADGSSDQGTPGAAAGTGGDCCLTAVAGVPPKPVAVAAPGWQPYRPQPVQLSGEPPVVFAACHDPIRGPPGAFFSL